MKFILKNDEKDFKTKKNFLPRRESNSRPLARDTALSVFSSNFRLKKNEKNFEISKGPKYTGKLRIIEVFEGTRRKIRIVEVFELYRGSNW